MMTVIILGLVPAWFLLFLEVCAIVIVGAMVYRYGHVVFSRWDLVMVLIALCGFAIFDSLLSIGETDIEKLTAISRGMRLIFVTVIMFISHRAMTRQKRLGAALDQWE